MLLKYKFSIFYFLTSCGTVALMVVGQFSDICGPAYVCVYQKTGQGPYVRKYQKTGQGPYIRATVPQLYFDLNVELMKITIQ